MGKKENFIFEISENVPKGAIADIEKWVKDGRFEPSSLLANAIDEADKGTILDFYNPILQAMLFIRDESSKKRGLCNRKPAEHKNTSSFYKLKNDALCSTF